MTLPPRWIGAVGCSSPANDSRRTQFKAYLHVRATTIQSVNSIWMDDIPSIPTELSVANLLSV